jgi:phi13 family phage major tail protein
MADVGLTNLHYAKMTTEDTDTTAPVYSLLKRLVGVNSIELDPEIETAILYGDNQALATVIKHKKTAMTLEVADLPLEDQSAIFGRTYDTTNKTMFISKDDKSPYLAIAYEINNHKGERFFWAFFKGKFAPSQTTNNTEGDSLEFGLHNLSGEFVFRIDNGMISAVKLIEPTDTTTTLQSWFTSITAA